MHHAPQHPAQVTCFLSRFRRNRFDQDRFFFLIFCLLCFGATPYQYIRGLLLLPLCSRITLTVLGGTVWDAGDRT